MKMKSSPNSSVDFSPQDFMIHSLKHFGEPNSFGKILKEVRAVGWRDKKWMLRARSSPVGTVSETRVQEQGGT